MLVPLLVFITFLQNCSAYIFSVNGSEYARMPPVYHFDNYQSCLHANNDSGVYCYVKFNLVSDGPSELYSMIKNYSDRIEQHFNHTILSYGICLTKTCEKYFPRNSTADQGATLEACLNDTLLENYKLKARVSKEYTCEKLGKTYETNSADIAVAVLLAVILLLNIIGSLRELKRAEDEGDIFAECFSIRRNWRRLFAPIDDGFEPRATRLKGFSGIKSLDNIMVMLVHIFVVFTINAVNTQYMEEQYQSSFGQFLANGTLVIQFFFVMSGFLLAYNLKLEEEKRKITFLTLIKRIINRYLRLTPAYAVVLGITATWSKRLGSGPLWQSVVVDEADQCRKVWWHNLIYINDYFSEPSCMVHTWYLGADFKMYVIGLTVLVLTRGPPKKLLLALLFLAGVVTSAAQTYMQNLDATFIPSPETIRNFYAINETFNYTYKRGHTSLSSFITGLVCGELVYRWQTTGHKFSKYIAKGYTSWLLILAFLATILSGIVFYQDGPRASVYFRAVYAGIMKPLYGVLAACFIVAVVFKFENVLRGLVEWRGWAVPWRLSYVSYLLHFLVIRFTAGNKTTLLQNNFLDFFQLCFGVIIITWLAAIPIYVLVEAPFQQLGKIIVFGRSETNNMETTEVNKEFGELKTTQMIYDEFLVAGEKKNGKTNEGFTPDDAPGV